LPLQIRDLLFSVGDLLDPFDQLFFALGYLTAEFIVLVPKRRSRSLSRYNCSRALQQLHPFRDA